MKHTQSVTLTCSVPTKEKDLLIGLWSAMELQGCEERETGDETTLTAYFANETIARKAQERIPGSQSRKKAVIATVVQQDWNAKWRESMQPALLAPGWWVSPKWLKPPMRRGDRWIRIEPKMAFGTGHHETTRLAAQAIITVTAARKSISKMLDIGTGSGVLCLVADMCGVPSTLGVEIDEDCRENLAENLADNKPKGNVKFLISGSDAIDAAARFDMVVMNMIYTESAPLLKQAARMLKAKGVVIWSGILANGKKEAIAAAKKAGLVLRSENIENEWWCGVLAKKPS